MFTKIIPAAFLAFSVIGAPLAMAEPTTPAFQHHWHHEDAEKHLARIHDALHLTAQQEPLWATFAKTALEAHQAQRQAFEQHRGDETTALEHFTRVSQWADTHAVSSKKVADAFAPLYASLTPDQKKSADTLFRPKHHHQQ